MSTVIHIGLQKAASTTLQNVLFSNHSRITYLGEPYNEECVTSLSLPDIEAMGEIESKIRTQEDTSFDKDEVQSLYDEHILPNLDGNNVTVLSNEHLTCPSMNADIELTARRLFYIMGPSKILYITRSQYTFIPSVYIDHFENDNRKKFREWLVEQKNSPGNGYFLQGRYFSISKIYAEIFGSENIKVIPFELIKEDSKRFFREVCDFIEVDPQEIIHLTDKHYNRRIRVGGLIKKGLVNQYEALRSSLFPGFRLSNYVPIRFADVEETLENLGPKLGLTIPECFIHDFKEIFGDENAKLSSAYGIDVERYNYPVS